MINIDFYTDYEDKEKVNKYNKFLDEYKKKINKIIGEALILNNIKLSKVYLGIGIVTPEKIHSINKEYRNVDKATDVLSFPMFTKEELDNISYTTINDEEVSIGDIVICLEVIEKQAVEYNTGFNREMLYMITHGICHLLGFDHIKQEDKTKMREMEEKILSKIGEI